MDAKLIRLIEAFLKNHRESDGGSWAPVTGDDMDQFHEIIDRLIELKWDEDCDGDLPIQYRVVNRNTHYGTHFRPIPYSHRIAELEGRDAIQRKMDIHHAVTLNFNLATRDMEHYHNGIDLDLREAKKRAPAKPKPSEEEMEDAGTCPECGRKTVVEAPGGGVKCVADDCAYWFCY